MGWFPDMFWLFLEWAVWLVAALGLGLWVGWMLWYRSWRGEFAQLAALKVRFGEERAALISRAERAEEAVREREGIVARLRKEHVEMLAEVDRMSAAPLVTTCARCTAELSVGDLATRVPAREVQPTRPATDLAITVSDVMPSELGVAAPAPTLSAPKAEPRMDMTDVERDVLDINTNMGKREGAPSPATAPAVAGTPPFFNDAALFTRLSELNAEKSSLPHDDLTRITAIHEDAAERLNRLGVHCYYQLALLDEPAQAVIERRLRMVEGAARENNWAAQAAQLHYEVHDEYIYDRVLVKPVYADALERGLAQAARGRRLDYRDDLKLIRGVGPKMERLLNDHGLSTFWQVAQLDADGVAALNSRLSFFPGRIDRDDWVSQAADLHARYHG